MELNRLNIAEGVSKILICMCFHVLDQHVVVDRGLGLCFPDLTSVCSSCFSTTPTVSIPPTRWLLL
jgi:hypothetical protein